jgi:hypothetical protein
MELKRVFRLVQISIWSYVLGMGNLFGMGLGTERLEPPITLPDLDKFGKPNP